MNSSSANPRSLPRPKSAQRPQERGTTAIEFAFVFPLLLVVMCGIFIFSFAFMGRQLLVNIAADTARACVLRSSRGIGAVQSCVASVGADLIQNMPNVCFGGRVSISSTPRALPQQGLGPTGRYPSDQAYLLIVTTQCDYPFAPAMTGVLSGGTLSTPRSLVGRAAMPFIIISGN